MVSIKVDHEFNAAMVGSGSGNTGSTSCISDSGSGSNSTTSGSTSFSSSPMDLSDNSLQLTIHKLNGKKYLEWPQSVRLVIDGKGILGYLIDEIKAPASTDSKYKHWRTENSIVTA